MAEALTVGFLPPEEALGIPAGAGLQLERAMEENGDPILPVFRNRADASAREAYVAAQEKKAGGKLNVDVGLPATSSTPPQPSTNGDDTAAAAGTSSGPPASGSSASISCS